MFPGQGAQFVGMGKDLYERDLRASELFERANDVLGFRITDVMFEGGVYLSMFVLSRHCRLSTSHARPDRASYTNRLV